jgi:hypothetical protein
VSFARTTDQTCILTSVAINGCVKRKKEKHANTPQRICFHSLIRQSKEGYKNDWERDTNSRNERELGSQQSSHNRSAVEHTCGFMPIVHVSNGNGHRNDRCNRQLPDDDEGNVDHTKHAAIIEAGDEPSVLWQDLKKVLLSETITYLCTSDSVKNSSPLLRKNMLPSSKAITTDNVILDRLYPGLLQ